MEGQRTEAVVEDEKMVVVEDQMEAVVESQMEAVVEEEDGDVHDLYGLLEEQRPKPRQ